MKDRTVASNIISFFKVVYCLSALSILKVNASHMPVNDDLPYFPYCCMNTLRVIYIASLVGACLNSNCGMNEKLRHMKYSKDTFFECIPSGTFINSTVKNYMEKNRFLASKETNHLHKRT